MTLPAISVIMAAYNGASLVEETIATLREQTRTDWELIVVDDCSTDNTLEVLRSIRDPRIRVIASERNQGPVCARNIAIAEARGHYIAALDQDDLCTPDRFARQAAYLDAHPETVLVASAALLMEDGIPGRWPNERSLSPAMIDWLLFTQNPLVWSTSMFRADAARALTPFTRPELRYAEDFDLYHRIRAFGRLARIDEPLLAYRCHPGGASQKFRTLMQASAAAVLAGRYARIFGEDAEGHAALVAQYLMGRDPVPDLPTLGKLSRILSKLHTCFVAENELTPQSRTEIDGEYARLWWLLARPALRQGHVGLRGALGVRPGVVRIHPADPDLIVSPLIGQARALVRSFGGRR
ncbi:glycosyltransferase family 2 protein [Sphingomonas soli]|uniref:glycosyltransferase family 2 protein n=1 Tax=Sphingomonas soli TaxID=266127 RepID=UPI00082C5DC5|nr:glycosyltransferase [Sphingomonas soli]